MSTKKTYYNDHHENPEVIAYRLKYIKTLKELYTRMRVWKILSEKEELEYLLCREWSPVKEVMPMGEEVTIDGRKCFVHHIDDQEGWRKDAVLHPLFTPGEKPLPEDWTCNFNHSYENCMCHCKLREYGQDESTYHSGDNPTSRWGIDGRSYAISKSKGISKMISAFKDYSKRGMCLTMSEEELKEVNDARVGAKFTDGTPMNP